MKYFEWYGNLEVDPPREYIMILPVKNRDGYYGWKFICWRDMPTRIDLAYSFTSLDNKEWKEKWKFQFKKGNPILSSENKQKMLKDLFQTIGKYGKWI